MVWQFFSYVYLYPYNIRDREVCDGKVDCEDGRDEVRMAYSDGEEADCDTTCRIYQPFGPGFSRGLRCRRGDVKLHFRNRQAADHYRSKTNCLVDTAWCDGQCDCEGCEDDEVEFCDNWECPDKAFHCSITRSAFLGCSLSFNKSISPGYRKGAGLKANPTIPDMNQ